MSDEQNNEHIKVNKSISEEKGMEFLKLMNQSEYNIIDQLKKTPR